MSLSEGHLPLVGVTSGLHEILQEAQLKARDAQSLQTAADKESRSKRRRLAELAAGGQAVTLQDLVRDVVDGAEPRVPSATRGVQGSGAAASLDAETDAKLPAVKLEKGFGGRVEQRVRAEAIKENATTAPNQPTVADLKVYFDLLEFNVKPNGQCGWLSYLVSTGKLTPQEALLFPGHAARRVAELRKKVADFYWTPDLTGRRAGAVNDIGWIRQGAAGRQHNEDDPWKRRILDIFDRCPPNECSDKHWINSIDFAALAQLDQRCIVVVQGAPGSEEAACLQLFIPGDVASRDVPSLKYCDYHFDKLWNWLDVVRTVQVWTPHTEPVFLWFNGYPTAPFREGDHYHALVLGGNKSIIRWDIDNSVIARPIDKSKIEATLLYERGWVVLRKAMNEKTGLAVRTKATDGKRQWHAGVNTHAAGARSGPEEDRKRQFRVNIKAAELKECGYDVQALLNAHNLLRSTEKGLYAFDANVYVRLLVDCLRQMKHTDYECWHTDFVQTTGAIPLSVLSALEWRSTFFLPFSHHDGRSLATAVAGRCVRAGEHASEEEKTVTKTVTKDITKHLLEDPWAPGHHIFPEQQVWQQPGDVVVFRPDIEHGGGPNEFQDWGDGDRDRHNAIRKKNNQPPVLAYPRCLATHCYVEVPALGKGGRHPDNAVVVCTQWPHEYEQTEIVPCLEETAPTAPADEEEGVRKSRRVKEKTKKAKGE